MIRAAFCLLLAACGCATTPDTPKGRLARLAETRCGETPEGRAVPLVYIRHDVLMSEEGPPTIAHELVHAAVIRRFPTCRAYFRWENQGTNSMEEEGAAFCASAQVWSQINAVPLSAGIEKYARWLELAYPQYGLTAERARALVAEPCREASP